jgi:hypothetical protein
MIGEKCGHVWWGEAPERPKGFSGATDPMLPHGVVTPIDVPRRDPLMDHGSARVLA